MDIMFSPHAALLVRYCEYMSNSRQQQMHEPSAMIGNIHRKFCEVGTCGFQDMCEQTETHTH